MALEGVDYSHSKKRKKEGSRKLQVGEKVEVRSIEDGFGGSWHPGEVICCEELTRHVRYENVLDDGGINYLEEAVTVSEALDGNIEYDNCYERGSIRPLPPMVDFGKWDLKFGLCVDVNHEEAWWEGVIFDRGDDMEERCVFFPDIGDEMQVGIREMRITQDWEEVTEEWTQRGKWVFLELVEKWESKLLVTVSAKQIWYDVRIKKEFERIREWTCNMEFLWKDLVEEVVNDYLSLTVKEVLLFLNLSGSLLDESPELEFVEPMANVEEILPEFQNQNGPRGADYAVVPGANAFEESRQHGSLSSNHWKHLKFTEVEPCPDAVNEYLLASNRESKVFWMNKLQKHLVYLGWKIEWTDRDRKKRYRYNVPEKLGQKFYLSLIEVCRVMKKDPEMSFLQLQNDQSIVHPTVDCHISDVPLNPLEDIQNPVILPPIVPSAPVKDEVDDDEPKFCPEAVEHYYESYMSHQSRVYKRTWIVKAKKHLLAVGWIFDYPPPDNKRRGIIYISPENRRFSTLHAACRFCLETKSDMQPVNVSWMKEENVDQVQGSELVCKPSQLLPKDTELQSMDGAASRLIANQKQRRLRDLKANTPKCQKPLRVLRSSKKVQKVSTASPLHHKPLNVLSCLIDNNIVLPRSKVYYKVKGRQRATRTWAVGKISHDGIKCNCCQKTYSICGFASHANSSSTCRPSASIFLDSGKSLLDCQMQMMQRHKTRENSRKSVSDFSLSENDYICSVCQYGGDLILCDQCPSSFHKTCLGLEEIPDGDWFCQSCRCGICGQRKIDGDEDENFLTCIQCEHKYHVRCLKNGSVDISRYLGNWFCGEDCEKIYEGLQKLLGEPVSVGVDNLTWTLVKFINPDSCHLGSSKSDLMVESYSKLKLALSVMHECFEPLNESFTSRDLVEDVIFSRRSELNRLNFQGFYTVILERNEEMISVATVRVHGKKVAELPLVGTRLQYRRHGMCRILINELEKMLKQLHVERLVLPAVPSVVETWTGCFGFAKMTDSERSQFLSYTFLDFQGTIMCQKLLMDISAPDSVLLIESQTKCDVSSGSCLVNFCMSSSVCETYRVEQIDKEMMVDLQMDTCAGNNDQPIVAIDPVKVEQPSHEDQQCHNGTTSSHSSVDKQVDRNNELYKFFYSRRKLRKTCEK